MTQSRILVPSVPPDTVEQVPTYSPFCLSSLNPAGDSGGAAL